MDLSPKEIGERIKAPDQYLRSQPHTLPHLFDVKNA